MPSVGEMFSGNDIDLAVSEEEIFIDTTKILNYNLSDYYWLMNAYGSSYVRFINSSGAMRYGSVSSTYGVRPSWYITNSNIVGGSGTANDPYRLK